MATSSAPGSATRLFLVYAAVSAVPVLALGLVLAGTYHTEAERRGLDEARSESAVIASTAVEPLLGGTRLTAPLDPATEAALTRMTTAAAAAGSVVRLRVRDVEGNVVFSPDGSGFGEAPDEEAVEAAEGPGAVEAEITRLNSDANDDGPAGEEVVEVYRPLMAGSPRQTVGVLEVYLPYEPIRHDVTAGLGTLYRDLAVGLALLYVVLAGLCLATTRRLQRQAKDNEFLADHDQLTGLPNRRLFQRRIAALAASSPDARGAVAVVDLDRFKEVNDSLGHENGDALLVELGRRLEAMARAGDTVARIGGDEFGIVLAGSAGDEDALAALEDLRDRLSMPLQLAGLPVTPEASIGFALLPQDARDAETLLQRADIAMYVAKASHAGVVRYDPAQDHYDADRLAVVSELRRALEHDELVLHYQPKMRLGDGAVASVEALIRWNHPRYGLLLPDAFLPLAEQTGLIDPLTDWVVARALQQMRAWEGAAGELAVAVNVSARNLSGPRFADRVLTALQSAGVAPGRLILEITETALFTDVERATSTLRRLEAAGVPISLDDFGQGQTSLGYLSRLPLAELKIDREFVTDMTSDRPHGAIVRSLVELAHNLGFSVVAEGVEDAGTMDVLRILGCDSAQGYVLSRPLPPDQLVEWLAAHRPAAYVG